MSTDQPDDAKPAELDRTHLTEVTGGMRWEEFRESTNVEDRRGLSRSESMRARSPAAPALPPIVPTPGDLSSQAGLDDVAGAARRDRRR